MLFGVLGARQGRTRYGRRTAGVVVCRAELDDDDGQDYVYKLAAAVRALAPEAYDSHLFALEVSICVRVFRHLWHPWGELLGSSQSSVVLSQNKSVPVFTGSVARVGSRVRG